LNNLYQGNTMRFLLVLALITLTSCATSIPQAENFPQSKQKKMMAAQHWNYVAKDAAERTKATLQNKGLAHKALYIAQDNEADFNKAFRNYMITNLLEVGLEVSTQKEGAIEVKYDTQVIKHASAFSPESIGYQPGYATAGVAGFWILHDVFKKLDLTTNTAVTTFGASAAYDLYKANNPGETGIEVILTTSIAENKRYLMMNADAYYLEDGEAWLFEGCKGRNRRYCR
jgi:hypothetical protein